MGDVGERLVVDNVPVEHVHLVLCHCFLPSHITAYINKQLRPHIQLVARVHCTRHTAVIFYWTNDGEAQHIVKHNITSTQWVHLKI